MISIALDGPSGSGKGALADGLAKKLNLIHLDTGAIFRCISYGIVKEGFSNPNEEEIKRLLPAFVIEIIFEHGSQKVLLNGENITQFLRTEDVSKMASKISVFAFVREKYLEIVRKFVSKNDCIIDGRDITSVVLPNADFKIYLTANEEVRAKRRYDENVSKNIPCTYEEVLENLRERDYRDSHRDVAPLVITPDALVVDNSNMTIDETVEFCYEKICEKLNIREK